MDTLTVSAPAASAPTRLAYSPEEVAQVLGLSRSAIYALLSDGSLRSLKVGRRRVIPATAVDVFLNGEVA
jgi:excisionase family DNA binding protein